MKNLGAYPFILIRALVLFAIVALSRQHITPAAQLTRWLTQTGAQMPTPAAHGKDGKAD